MKALCTKPTLLFKYLLLAVLSICWQSSAFATHSAGSDITYRCLGGLNYEVTVSFYRDCGGVAEPASITVNCRSANGTANISLTAMKLPGYGNEITLPCSGTATNCNGGTGTGIREWKYRTTVTLPSEQADWVFSYSICCRNCSITTIQSPCAANSVLYVEARLNNLNGICNSAPTFTNVPVAYVCLGQNYHYNHGVVDTDGDSLVYSLVAPKTSSSTNVTFIAPYSTNAPVASSTPFLLNPATGDINFTPSQIQIGILAILVKEYRGGVLIGSVIRDMQVYINPCNNNLPTLGGINNSSSNLISACTGQPVCFTIQSMDADTTQSLSLSTNNGIPGATYQISGGSRPALNFCWTPSIADAGKIKSFTVRVQDNACPYNGVQVFSYNIQVNSRLELTATSTQCNRPDGSAAVAPLAGNNSYLWSNGATTSAINHLTGGLYTVTVTTGNGCILTDTVRVENTGLLLINGESNTTCSSNCTGKITIQPIGGTAPYTYTWSSGNSTATLQNLCTGNYVVTVTDQNGCTADSIFSIQPSPLPTVQLQHTDQLCQQKGYATVTVSGTFPPFAVLWSTGDTTYSVSQLNAGNYWIKITDAKGCDTTLTFTIQELSSPISIQSTIQSVTCSSAANGSIQLSPAGGSTSYNYHWSNGATTSGIFNLAAGNYIFTILDQYGCSLSDTLIVATPLPIALNAVITHPVCNLLNGSVQLQPSGGTAPYLYQWNTGQTTGQLTGLNNGTYTVSITDAAGCIFIDSVTLIRRNSLQATITSASPTCIGIPNGTAQIIPLGGTPPYTVQWNDGVNTLNRNDLVPGNYSVTITDSLYCSITQQTTILQPAPIAFTSTVKDAECIRGINGSIQIHSAGASSSIYCIWADSIRSFTQNDLIPGTYVFSITDSNGCKETDSVEIKDISRATIQSDNDAEICMGEKAHLFIDNLEEDAKIQWYYNNEALKGAVKRDFYTPAEGMYSVIVNTSCGNIRSNEITVKVNAMQQVQISNEQVICPGDKAEISASGGVSYRWLPAEGLTDSLQDKITVSPTQTTVYSVVITDEVGCTAVASVKVTVLCDNTAIPSGFSPNEDGVNDYFIIEGIDEHPGNVIYIYNRWGNLVFKQKEYDNRWKGESNVAGPLTGQQLPDGTYYYILDLNNNQPPATGYVLIRR